MLNSIHQEPFQVKHLDGVIRGMTYRPGGAEKSGAGRRYPAVLMMHGFTGQRIEAGFLFVTLARALARRGVAAVAFDFRHSGESDGSFERMLVTGELDDALRITGWTQSQPFVDRSRLGVLGFSLGGLLACCTGAQTNAFTAMALLAPTTVDNLCRYAKQREENGQITIGPHTLHPKFFDDLRTLDPLIDAVTNPRPTLVVQGTDDTAVTPQVSRKYIDAMERAGVDVSLQLIEGADHGFGKPAIRKQTVIVVCDWLAKQLHR